VFLRADSTLLQLFGGVVGLLITATAAGAALRRCVRAPDARAMVDNINARIRAWWVMAVVFMLSVATGAVGSILLFTAISFLALREFVTLAPTARGDHRALLWCFFVFTPLEYYLVWRGSYELFAILIPVFVTTFLAIRTAIAGDTARYLQRTSAIQWGLLVCVYFVSYVPALLMLRIPGYAGPNAALIFFLVLVVQLSDVLQYIWGKTMGRRLIAPSVSPHKTWEGFIGGVLSATAAGAAIWWATPFAPAQAALIALAVALTGFAGGLIMSAIKRDLGVKDYGSMIPGHGGVLDRIDSLCFAAPVFFHITRFFYA
jgi:phosphatidate cytidylyltransferase